MLSLTDAALAKVHDPARIRKVYKLVAPKGGREGVGDDAEALIIGSMALKGA
jgi:EKC/KEOPS complex subunit CGI121/TPRKB